MENNNFNIDIFEINEPILTIGSSVNIPEAGTPECFGLIGGLYTKFFDNGIIESIPNKMETLIEKNKGHFGICQNHKQNNGKIEFTYVIAVKVNKIDENTNLPKDTENIIYKMENIYEFMFLHRVKML